MQQVVIIPMAEWQRHLQKLEQQEKRLARLEKGLSEYVSTREAMKITGLSDKTLKAARDRGELAYKFEGTKPLYLRTSLEEYNETHTPRRKRA